MINELILYVFLAISLINTIHFGVYIAGANWYDIKRFRLSRLPKSRPKNKRPLVTVIVPAHNEAMGIVQTLESIRKNTYHKIHILVVDDASTDNTRSLVWRYIKKHPKRDIRLLRKQKNVGKGEALNHALRVGAKGDLVMTLDADSLLDRKAISNAVKHFDDPKVVAMAANVQVMDSRTLLGLLQKFEHLIGYRSKKFYTVSNSEFVIGGVASTFRYEVIKKLKFYDTDTQTEDIGLSLKLASQGNKHQRIIYASDVLAKTQGVQSYRALFKQRYRWKLGMLQNIIKQRQMIGSLDRKYSRMLTLYRLPMAILGEAIIIVEPIMVLYILWLSLTVGNFATFIGAYIFITLYLLWGILPDEHLSKRSKLKLGLSSVLMYFMFFVMNIVQFVAIIRCIKHNKQLRLKVPTSGTWTSPERTHIAH